MWWEFVCCYVSTLITNHPLPLFSESQSYLGDYTVKVPLSIFQSLYLFVVASVHKWNLWLLLLVMYVAMNIIRSFYPYWCIIIPVNLSLYVIAIMCSCQTVNWQVFGFESRPPKDGWKFSYQCWYSLCCNFINTYNKIF